MKPTEKRGTRKKNHLKLAKLKPEKLFQARKKLHIPAKLKPTEKREKLFHARKKKDTTKLKLLLKTMRSKRGTLTTKIKDAVFAVFGDSMLDRIDSNAISEEGHNWKQSAKTKATYSKLFSLIVANNPEDTYISHIFTKVFPKEETAGVPEISNVQSKDAPETTQVQEETKKSGTTIGFFEFGICLCFASKLLKNAVFLKVLKFNEKLGATQNPEEDIAEGSDSAKKQDATHNSEEDIAKGSGTSTKCNSPEIPEKSRKRQKKDKEVQKAAAVTAVKPKK
ncbi:hypothetical protein C2G38_2270854 [Gigaspora rosea]|uniref:Uncharacterized protein n=1 Tax=Gigaspora rosea TaxID=44941 RepID=A0A397UE79_9GLOM|nr:hypothetical protein C2G38_2270854 [Gigaspora rosea]